ncbi:MAG TPA: cupredoxin domain-containing protein [Gaiellaceae bacterium]|nr:cupredoxin domain-containing protein [Gaiellaceae bacterium]
MRWARRAAFVACALLLSAQAAAAAPSAEVQIQFAAYGPSDLDVLPGQTVLWTNVSRRTHTVTSDTGAFDSGDVEPDGRFAFRFDRAGTYRYHCTIHASIVGDVAVRRVILGPLPTATVPLGSPVEFSGRAADPSLPVKIQLRQAGSAFATIARAVPHRDGSWRAVVAPKATGDYRALSGRDASQTRRLLVGVRRVRVHATRRGVGISVTPAAPYASVLVEVYRRERFGWWPVRRARLDYVSEAEVQVAGPARVRVVLVDDDGWTPIATSPVVAVGRR